MFVPLNRQIHITEETLHFLDRPPAINLRCCSYSFAHLQSGKHWHLYYREGYKFDTPNSYSILRQKLPSIRFATDSVITVPQNNVDAWHASDVRSASFS